MSARSIDLNCDMGEGAVDEREIMPWISSANIACGAHAGDPGTMRETARVALEHGVAIGAHPGFPDREGFGRRPMSLTTQEVRATVEDQIRALARIVRAEGAALRHVKPHGALYNMAADDDHLAGAIAEAVQRVDPTLVLFGLAGSALVTAGRRAGLATAAEAFADRGYRPDGSLVPRMEPGALLSNPDGAAAQALAIAHARTIQAETLCIHGDSPGASAIARAVNQALRSAGIEIRPPEPR